MAQVMDRYATAGLARLGSARLGWPVWLQTKSRKRQTAAWRPLDRAKALDWRLNRCAWRSCFSPLARLVGRLACQRAGQATHKQANKLANAYKETQIDLLPAEVHNHDRNCNHNNNNKCNCNHDHDKQPLTAVNFVRPAGRLTSPTVCRSLP